MLNNKPTPSKLVWNSDYENYFLESDVFLGYPWKVRGIIKSGSLVEMSKNVFVERFAVMAQGRFYTAGAFSYCRSSKIPSDFRVGRYCSIAPNVEVSDQNHPLDRLSTHSFTFKAHAQELAKNHNKSVLIKSFRTLDEPPRIGHDVWIGRDVLLKRGITIGHGAVVGQRSVVTKDVPPYAVVVGIPARIVKYRFSDELISELLALEWWDYPFFDFADIDVSQVDAFIDKFRDRIEKKNLAKLQPAFNLRESFLNFIEMNELNAEWV